MHGKFLIVDRQTLETGSFNFTAAAEARNAENVLVLHDAALAQQLGSLCQDNAHKSEIG
jgi:phosphatidylserine/phosphatidylglycerophosphate/cardiolipin synthase-like enzyme